MKRPLIVCAVVAGVLLAGEHLAAKVKVRVDFDKTFAFNKARTWGWSTAGAGQVIVARTPNDDPAAIKQRAEPLVMAAVNTEMPKRGLKYVEQSPDLRLTYYVLITIGTSAQTMGQFLPAVTDWGLPPFAPATQSLEYIEKGAMALDLMGGDKIVWRGVGEAQIDLDLDQKKRAALIQEAVQKILERYPPKS
jgi:hypothetical protein